MLRLPRYTGKDLWVYLGMMPFIVGIFNLLIFGAGYVSSVRVFLLATLVTWAIMSLSWISLTWVAVTLRDRFSRDASILKRMAVALFLFILILAVTTTAIFQGYDYFHFLGYRLNEERYHWMLGIGVVFNFIATFLHEGVSGFEKWKATLTRTEQLKKEYLHSQLLGLKSQLNPHFLFNSLNSLSSLIAQEPKKAETFLNELSKVYRYLLRHTEDRLVPLEAELQYVHSCYYLLQARYGDGIVLDVDVSEGHRQLCLPPLTLQALFDMAYSMNTIGREQPLRISMTSAGDCLEIRNNIQLKVGASDFDYFRAMENIANKFRLLCGQVPEVSRTDNIHIIRMPLIRQEALCPA